MKKKRSNVISYGRMYTNIAIFTLSILIAIVLFQNESFHTLLLHLGKLEYLGAFIAGLFFVTTFAVVPATVVFLILAETLPIWVIALIGGIGAMTGDYILFRFVRDDGVAEDILTLFKRYGGKRLTHLFRSKYFHWTMPIVGALIIISPIPDEIGVSLMGISKMKSSTFLILSYLLNAFGILVILLSSVVVKP